MIPVFSPDIGRDEMTAVADALKKGEISGSFGTYIEKFEQQFAQYCGCGHGIAVTSGTAALFMAVRAAGIGPGDEVLVSSCTNIATALAVTHNGAVPVPVDSESTTWNLNLDLIEGLITPRTRAIIPVHLYGHPVDMDRLCELADRNHVLVIEDCAESHGATCRGRMTGSFGVMGCFSFYANKIITTGEGGMIVTNDPAYAQHLRSLRNLAFSKPRFRHEEAAFNFRMTGYQAAMGVAQLKRIESVLSQKRRVALAYTRELKGLRGLQLPYEAAWARNVFWMYAAAVHPEFQVSRDDLMAWLHENGIETRTFFCPMNQQPCLQKVPGFRSLPCPVADELWRTGLYLPSSPRLTGEEISMICDTIRRTPGRTP